MELASRNGVEFTTKVSWMKRQIPFQPLALGRRLGSVSCHLLALGAFLSMMPQLAWGQASQQMPAFEDPKFREKLWEAGGPQFRGNGKVILSVTIEGERTVSENKILSHMQSRADRIYDPEQLNRDLHELHRTELFTKIETKFQDTPDGVHLLIRVYEKPIVEKIVFHSNTRIRDHELSRHLGLSVGDPVGPAAAEQAKNRLLDLYRDKGFANVSVKIVEGNKPNDRNVIFSISEGERERIQSIRFIGNEAFSSSLLKTKIECKDARYGLTKYLWNIADRSKIRDDNARLLEYYRRLGYFDAKIDHYLEYDASGAFLDLTFTISEGKPYSVNEVTISGNKYHTVMELQAGLLLNPGMPFNQDRMERDARHIREIYGAQGFIFVDVTPTPQWLPDNKLNLHYEIEEGDVYRASEINVHIAGDSSFTKQRVALNLMGGRLRENSIIDARELDHAQRRLMQPLIFEANPQLGDPPKVVVESTDDQAPKKRRQ